MGMVSSCKQTPNMDPPKRLSIAQLLERATEDCKLVVTCKMQNRNATDKLNPQCSKLALLIVLANNANLLHC